MKFTVVQLDAASPEYQTVEQNARATSQNAINQILKVPIIVADQVIWTLKNISFSGHPINPVFRLRLWSFYGAQNNCIRAKSATKCAIGDYLMALVTIIKSYKRAFQTYFNPIFNRTISSIIY
jgi:hypothetical protein